MAYTIIGSIRSPFVRACRMLMIQNSIDFEFKVLNFVEDPKDAAQLSSESPINKVPILVDGDQKIFDSRVIMNFLTKKHNLKKLSLDEENILSCIYSCLDTGVILFLMRRDGIDLSRAGFFMERNRNRIPANLKFIEPWVKALDHNKKDDWNFASMALYSFLYWAQARDLIKIEDYPVYQDFLVRFAKQEGVKETSF